MRNYIQYNGKEYETVAALRVGWEPELSPFNKDFDNRIFSYEDTKDFLQEKLDYMGLTPKEYNEFIVYWLPILQQNEYNLISFAGEEYSNYAKLEITPKPDSILRVMMIYKALDKPLEIKEQQLKQFERTGFSVIEWGGRQVY